MRAVWVVESDMNGSWNAVWGQNEHAGADVSVFRTRDDADNAKADWIEWMPSVRFRVVQYVPAKKRAKPKKGGAS